MGDIAGPGRDKGRGRALVMFKIECLQRERNSPGDPQKRAPVRHMGECRRREGWEAAISFLLWGHFPLRFGINSMLV